MSHLIWHNSGTITARYTYSIIPSVQTKVLFPYNRDIGISYVRLLLHDSMLKDDSHRTGTSTSPICECGSDRETAEHFLFHCTQYQHIRKNTVESVLDILKCSKKWSMSDNVEFVLLSPSIDSITKSQNRTVKDLLFYGRPM